MSSEYLKIIADLMSELSTEIDLHYDDDDFASLSTTFDKLREAAAVMEQNGVTPPQAYTHIVGRYLQRHN